MHYRLKGIFSLAMLALLSLSFMGVGCGGSGGGQNQTNHQKPVNVSKFSKIYKSIEFVYEDDAMLLTLSGDKNWIYFVTNSQAKLYGAEIGGEANFAKIVDDEDKWGSIALATNLDDTAGKAALANAQNVYYLSPATDGVLASLISPTATDNGVSYIKGRIHTLAWKSANSDLDNVHNSGDRVVGSIIKKKIATNQLIDVPYVVNLSTDTMVTHATLEADKMTSAVNYNGNPFPFIPKLASDDVSGKVFAVNEIGIAIMEGGDVGIARDFAAVDIANAGPALWRQDNSVDNDYVSELFVANGKLYIALSASGPNTGGVAVYDIATLNTKAPTAASWSGETVIGFTELDGRVLAVSKDGLYEVDDSGLNVVKGAFKITPAEVADANNQAVKKYDSLKDGYEGSMPANITGAKFVGSHLFITTDNDGVHVMVKKKVMVDQPK